MQPKYPGQPQHHPPFPVQTQRIDSVRPSFVFGRAYPALAGESDQAEATRIAYARGGYKGVLEASLKAVQNQRAAGAYTNRLGHASIHAQLGNKDLAFKALEEAYAERVDMVWLNVDPAWDPIRSDPRFQDLLRRVGLPVNTGPVVIPH